MIIPLSRIESSYMQNAGRQPKTYKEAQNALQDLQSHFMEQGANGPMLIIPPVGIQLNQMLIDLQTLAAYGHSSGNTFFAQAAEHALKNITAAEPLLGSASKDLAHATGCLIASASYLIENVLTNIPGPVFGK